MKIVRSIKRLPHSFYFRKVKCIKINLSVFILCFGFVETLLKMKLIISVTKYTDILIFNFAHIITPKCHFKYCSSRTKSHKVQVLVLLLLYLLLHFSAISFSRTKYYIFQRFRFRGQKEHFR